MGEQGRSQDESNDPTKSASDPQDQPQSASESQDETESGSDLYMSTQDLVDQRRTPDDPNDSTKSAPDPQDQPESSSDHKDQEANASQPNVQAGNPPAPKQGRIQTRLTKTHLYIHRSTPKGKGNKKYAETAQVQSWINSIPVESPETPVTPPRQAPPPPPPPPPPSPRNWDNVLRSRLARLAAAGNKDWSKILRPRKEKKDDE